MELVEEYEISRAQYILGIKWTAQNDLLYIMKWKDVVEPESLTSEEVKSKWPNLLIKFFEKKMTFLKSRHPQQIGPFESIGNFDDEPPVRILGCTDINGLQYWCEWNSNQRKLLPSQHEHFDKNILLINFWEGKIMDEGDNSTGAFSTIVTRGMKSKAAQLGFSYSTKPVIFRNIELEKYILTKPSAVVDRRQSTKNVGMSNVEVEPDEMEDTGEETPQLPHPPNIGINLQAPIGLKLKVAIPFGARGRKRRVSSFPSPFSINK